MTKNALLLTVAAAALAACQADEPEVAPPPPSTTLPAPPGTCAVIESREWHAWINAMPSPGPQTARALIVTGEIVLPTPGYKITLTPGIADRSATPVQQMILTLTPPDGPVPQVLHPETVRYEGPAITMQYRAIRIMCGGQMLTEIEDIPVAR